MSFGLDLSERDSPDWGAVEAAGCAFAYVRLADGAHRDRKAKHHVAELRALAIPVGAYLSFRFEHSVGEQYAAFVEIAFLVRYGTGDRIPALFIEAAPLPGYQPTRDWWEPCRMLVKAMERRFGACIIHVGADDWWAMGSPGWMLERPLWVPRYGSHHLTTVGGRAPLIWRRRVGLLDPQGEARNTPGPGALGHNQAFGEIPRCIDPRPSSIPPSFR